MIRCHLAGVAAAVGCLAFGCASSNQAVQKSSPSRALASLEPKSGSSTVGTVAFEGEPNGKVDFKLQVTGAPAGKHAVHLHDKGDCSAADASSAGGHWNPTTEAHGKWGSAPHHLGDIGNLEVGPDGKGELTLSTDKWTVNGATPEGKPLPTDVLGHAVVVHAAVDDFTTQPTGNAGGRIACGVVQRE